MGYRGWFAECGIEVLLPYRVMKWVSLTASHQRMNVWSYLWIKDCFARPIAEWQSRLCAPMHVKRVITLMMSWQRIPRAKHARLQRLAKTSMLSTQITKLAFTHVRLRVRTSMRGVCWNTLRPDYNTLDWSQSKHCWSLLSPFFNIYTKTVQLNTRSNRKRPGQLCNNSQNRWSQHWVNPRIGLPISQFERHPKTRQWCLALDQTSPCFIGVLLFILYNDLFVSRRQTHTGIAKSSGHFISN